MSKYIKEAEKLLPDRDDGFNKIIDEVIPIVAKLLEEIDNLKQKLKDLT